MKDSLLNVVCFLLNTILYYYLFAPKLSYEDTESNEKMLAYENKKIKTLTVYCFFVIVCQFFINTYAITNKCGGNAKSNIAFAAMYTILPWLCMFGFVIVALTVFPAFKLVFSDVIGYFYISSAANNLLTELLVDEKVEEHMNKTNMSDDEKAKITKVADTIIKICGNTSILINRMLPSNFEEFWRILSPLKKAKYQPTRNDDKYVENPDAITLKENLLKLVVTKDNVGEAMWFAYTGILISSIISMKIATNKCYISQETMEKNYKDFQEKEEQIHNDKENAKETVYTID